MWHVIEFLAGLVLVLLIMADVFSTVLMPRATARHVRIGPIVNGLLAPLWRHGVRPVRSKRDRQTAQASLGPFMLVIALATWVSLLALGFAMMLHAQPHNVALQDFGFGEALFQSALAISTLGMIHAEISGWARALVAIEGVSGFAILTLTVAFLLQLQDALHRRESLVLTFPGRAGKPPSALGLLGAMHDARDSELAALFDRWETWTAEVMQSHLSYPVLFRFRSLDADCEWLACLATMLDAAALLRTADPVDLRRTVRQAGFFLATAERAVHEFSRLLGIEQEPPRRDQGDLAGLVDTLKGCGFAPRDLATFDERLRANRAAHDMALPSIADRLDLAWHDPLTTRDDL